MGNYASNKSGKFKANESQKGMMMEAVEEDENVSQQIADLDKKMRPEEVGLQSEFES